MRLSCQNENNNENGRVSKFRTEYLSLRIFLFVLAEEGDRWVVRFTHTIMCFCRY